MILCLAEVLSTAQLEDLALLLRRAPFAAGAATAGWSARGVKHNLQLDARSAEYRTVRENVDGALAAHDAFVAAALPRSVGSLLVSRSETGMGYGTHVDNALMGTPPIRTDLAFTLFLVPPDSYEGGELVVEDAEGEQTFKLAAGALVLYPATTLHRVEPVRSGVRDVVAGWVQSYVRDPRVRELLFDLDRVRRALFETEGKSERFDLLSKAHSNLLRLHAET